MGQNKVVLSVNTFYGMDKTLLITKHADLYHWYISMVVYLYFYIVSLVVSLKRHLVFAKLMVTLFLSNRYVLLCTVTY